MSKPPVIRPPLYNVDTSQALTDIIESVAREETALAHILNAEADKIQKSLACTCKTDDLIKVNESVNKTLKNLIKLQILLEFKLEKAENFLDETEE